MLIEADIYASYEDQIGNASASQLKELDGEVERLRGWGDRWSRDVKIPAHIKFGLPRLFEHKGEVVEVPVEMVYWPLEQANQHMLKYVDIRMVEAFKTVKRMGFSRPSAVLYGRLFTYLHSDKVGREYEGKLQDWGGPQLMLRRIHTTTRVAYRYEKFEKYGDRTKHKGNGDIERIYGRRQWRDELIRRGVIPRPKN